MTDPPNTSEEESYLLRKNGNQVLSVRRRVSTLSQPCSHSHSSFSSSSSHNLTTTAASPFPSHRHRGPHLSSLNSSPFIVFLESYGETKRRKNGSKESEDTEHELTTNKPTRCISFGWFNCRKGY
ncbi:hypothetical protein L195_g055036 [Trifolium pratense]|uniref:Uncharacterized protein n=1 Tax=Trifolium pratense TaxID=57577 RepID=A0A2K3KJ72_TRIPR|nr:hypothetical protein L195_g055036 [Trifolium pratense]